jgi:hypothetical protein
MSRIVATEQEDRILLPTDTLLALTTTEVALVERDGRNGPYNRLEFKFKVLDILAVGNGQPKDKYLGIIGGPVWGGVSARLTTALDNPLRLWTEALLNIQVTPGFELDTDYLVNRKCRGVIQQYVTRKTDSLGNEIKGHSVSHILGIGHPTEPIAMPPNNSIVAAPGSWNGSTTNAWGDTNAPF